jgi:PAS domain S-box-containing protein
MIPQAREAGLLNGHPPVEPCQDSEILLRATASLQGALRLDDVLDQLLRSATQTLGVERAEIYLYDERDQLLIGRHATSRSQEGGEQNPSGGPQIKIPITDTCEVMSAAVLTRKAHTIDDLREPAGDLRLHDLLLGRGQGGSFAAIPLVAFSEVVGVLTLEDHRGLQSLRRPSQLLDTFAAQAGLALERARLHEERERSVKELTFLQKASAAIQGSLPLPEILQRVLEGVIEGLDVDRATLFLYDAGSSTLRGARAAVRSPETGGVAAAPEEIEGPSWLAWLQDTLQGIEIPVGGAGEVMSATVLERRPFVMGDTRGSNNSMDIADAVISALQTRSFATAPLLANDRVVGVLTVDNFRRRSGFRGRLHLLMAYAAQAAPAILRTLLEEELRASEQHYRQFVEHSPDGIVETTLDGRIVACNDGLLRLLGYRREELLAMNARSVYANPDQRDKMVDSLAERGIVESLDVEVMRKGGGTAFVNFSARLRRGAGEPVIQCIIRDATERYEVERRMRMFNDVVTYSPDAIATIDPTGNVSSWNMGAQSIFGYTSEEMIGRQYRTIVPPDRIDEYLNDIKARVENEGHLVGFETERLHKDGRRIPVCVTVSRLKFNGGPDMGWSVVVRDITDRKREGERRALLSSITEQSPDAILSVDHGGRITSWNSGAEKMFGYPAGEIVGNSWLELAPSDREPEYHAMMSRPHANESQDGGSRAGAAPRAIDTVARTRDAKLLPVRLSASVLRSESGAEVGWSVILRDLTEQRSLAEMSERLQEELYSRNRLEGIVGHSRVMEEVRERIRRVARFNSSVMIIGPSGTGKEIAANAIHYNSSRRQRPFIKVNCAAIPEELLETELFGIERNVATGVDGRMGRFELADGGTLFLDEIGDMSLATQAKILRVLQEREFERVGGKKVIKVDVRILAATNKDLEAEIKSRRFRDDLFYRLNVIVIALPPLVDRREDIDPLVDHFLEKFTRENNLPKRRLSLSARMILNEYPWPGNVRELEHCIERAVVMGEGSEIAEVDLPPSILIWRNLGGAGSQEGHGGLHDILKRVERRAVLEALERCGWVQARAARMLGISERSMWYRVKKLELRAPTR